MNPIETLEQRRKRAFLKFSNTAVLNERYKEWFPTIREERRNMNLRSVKTYQEFNCRTNRLYNSPLFAMRRVLNSPEEVEEIEESLDNHKPSVTVQAGSE